jgi:hypothetical protein
MAAIKLNYIPQFATTTLNVPGGITDSQTTGIILTSVPSDIDITKPGIVCISYANPLVTSTAEYVRYTSIDGSNELQGVTRASEGYSAKAHANGVTVAWIVSKSHINEVMDALGGVSTGVSLNTPTITSGALTTPKITTSINDANGNEVIKTPATTSAVNEITVTNAAASGTPNVTATGDDTNINLILTGKGTGSVLPKMAAPQGFLINGKIVPSVGSNNLTVAIKGMDGNDPSASNPVYCRIGDTVRTITSALSVTKNAGTNWFNSGATEYATLERDYFVYLGYNATDGVVIGFSPISHGTQYGDFSTTTTEEDYCAISTITNAASTDYYENIGRFAATLSAGAGYTWSVPTFTALNLIQRPIYESRWLNFVSAYSGSESMTVTYSASRAIKYKVNGNSCTFNHGATLITGGTASYAVYASFPFSGLYDSSYTHVGSGYAQNSGGYNVRTTTSGIEWRRYDGGSHPLSTSNYFGQITYQI